MGKMLALVKSGLARSLHKCLPFWKIKIAFKISNRLKNYFIFKDVVPEPLRSCLIYNFTCGSCNASYIGKTFRHMKIRVPEHQGVSPRTGKHLKGTLSTSVKDHMLDYNHIVAWHDFKILGRESNHWLVEIRESLFIKRDRLSLNKNIYFQELFIFYLYDVRYKILIAFICCYWIVVCNCKFSRFLISSCKQFTISIDVYSIMEAVTSESL